MRLRSNKGFTLIELLIVVAIIGIIAAIAIPNLLNAIQRGKQKRSMADMRSIGTAVESYQVDNGYPPGCGNSSDLRGVMSNYLEPTFIRTLPAQDAWKFNFQIAQSVDEYTIISYGKNRSTDGCVAGTLTKNFNNDICYSNGQYSQYPDGTQQ